MLADQLRDHLGIHRGAARGHLAYRVHELADVEHPVLEQVAHTSGAVGQQFARIQLLDVLRQHEYRQPRHLGAGLDGGAQPLVGERRWQPHVHHGDVGTVRGERPHQRRPVIQRLDHVEVVRLEQPDQTDPEEGEVFGEDGAETGTHGNTVARPAPHVGAARAAGHSGTATARTVTSGRTPRSRRRAG
jgi:hypothetical protein